MILNGYDETLAAGLMAGASGAVGSTFNLMGRRYTALAAAFLASDLATVQRLQASCNAIIDVLVRHGVFTPLKYLPMPAA